MFWITLHHNYLPSFWIPLLLYSYQDFSIYAFSANNMWGFFACFSLIKSKYQLLETSSWTYFHSYSLPLLSLTLHGTLFMSVSIMCIHMKGSHSKKMISIKHSPVAVESPMVCSTSHLGVNKTWRQKLLPPSKLWPWWSLFPFYLSEQMKNN